MFGCAVHLVPLLCRWVLQSSCTLTHIARKIPMQYHILSDFCHRSGVEPVQPTPQWTHNFSMDLSFILYSSEAQGFPLPSLCTETSIKAMSPISRERCFSLLYIQSIQILSPLIYSKPSILKSLIYSRPSILNPLFSRRQHHRFLIPLSSRLPPYPAPYSSSLHPVSYFICHHAGLEVCYMPCL